MVPGIGGHQVGGRAGKRWDPPSWELISEKGLGLRKVENSHEAAHPF